MSIGALPLHFLPFHFFSWKPSRDSRSNTPILASLTPNHTHVSNDLNDPLTTIIVYNPLIIPRNL